MNPYDFVRVDWEREPERRLTYLHNSFKGLSGRIEARLTALTPLFLPAKRQNGNPLTNVKGATLFSQSSAYRSEANAKGYFIPGTSLKGLIRNVVETIAQGCFWHFRNDKLPLTFRPCRPINVVPLETPLCPACRLFGLINSEQIGQEKVTVLRLGNVSFEDAICIKAVDHPPIYTAVLSTPKPQHKAFYMDNDDSDKIAGRKFYFHSKKLLTERGWNESKKGGKKQNAYIHPLDACSTFTFAAEFNNLEEDDLTALFYALSLEEGVRHKFGYAKPCGLGSVHIQLTKLTLRDFAARYRHGSGMSEFAGGDLAAEVQRRVYPFVATIAPLTRKDMKRIWQWPPAKGVTYRYPSRDWFQKHPSDPISRTP